MKKSKPVRVISTASATAPPCYECDARHFLCHANCEKYKQWREDIRDLNERERKENAYRFYVIDRFSEKERSMNKGTREYNKHYRRVK